MTFRASWSRASTPCPNGQPQCASQIVSTANVLVLRAQAGSVTYDGLNIDGRGGRPATQVFESFNGDNITVRNSRIGNIVDGKGAMSFSSNLTFDNVYFHDVIATNSNVHNECIQMLTGDGPPGGNYLNSEFRNCATMDASIGWPDWWQPPAPPWHTLRMEQHLGLPPLHEQPGLPLLRARAVGDPAAKRQRLRGDAELHDPQQLVRVGRHQPAQARWNHNHLWQLRPRRCELRSGVDVGMLMVLLGRQGTG